MVPSGREELENSKTLKVLVNKLPYHIQDRWRRMAVRESESGRRVGYDNLVTLVDEEARAANHPLYGKSMKGEEQERQFKKFSKVHCGAVQKVVECSYCNDEHGLERCDKFRKTSRSDKIRFLRDNKLCYLCMRGIHIARDCTSSVSCLYCSRRHNTLLHIYHQEQGRESRPPNHESIPVNRRLDSQEIVDLSTSRMRADAPPLKLAMGEPRTPVSAASINHGERVPRGSMAVFAVRVGITNKTVKTNAFLDNGSSVSFCTYDLVNRLKLSKTVTPVSLPMGTMNGTTIEKCGLITGLSVADLSESPMVPLPPLYVVRKLPVNGYDALPRSQVRKYDYLDGIDLPNVDEPVEIMIGANAHRALQPLEVLPEGPVEDEPYAVRTRIGWAVYGGNRQHFLSIID